MAERDAIEAYRDMVRYFADKDPPSPIVMERIPAQEVEHANDKICEGLRESFWVQGMMCGLVQGMICGLPAAYFCVKVFSETDVTEDLK